MVGYYNLPFLFLIVLKKIIRIYFLKYIVSTCNLKIIFKNEFRNK